MNKSEKRLASLKKQGVEIFDKMPDGWKEIKGATTAPNGFAWIHNCQSPFTGEYKHALVKIM